MGFCNYYNFISPPSFGVFDAMNMPCYYNNFNTNSIFGNTFGGLLNRLNPMYNITPQYNFGFMPYNTMLASPQWLPLVPNTNLSFGMNNTNSDTVSSSSNNNSNTTNPIISNAVELAKTQIGVKEIGESNDSAEIRKYKNGKIDGKPWCASFVSWLYGKGQGLSNNNTFGYQMYSQDLKEKAVEADCFAEKNSGYTPQVGDLAMWTYSKGGHTGIISQVYDDGSFDTIEGNYEDRVSERHYESENETGKGFSGFVQMNKWLA